MGVALTEGSNKNYAKEERERGRMKEKETQIFARDSDVSIKTFFAGGTSAHNVE